MVCESFLGSVIIWPLISLRLLKFGLSLLSILIMLCGLGMKYMPLGLGESVVVSLRRGILVWG